MTTECRAIGMVPQQGVMDLANMMRGRCTQYRDFSTHEVVLRMPLQQGATSTAVKLVRHLPSQRMQHSDADRNAVLRGPVPDRWTLVYESGPQRGQQMAELPATVREVMEANCFSNTTPQFWQVLGAKVEYELVRAGNEYLVTCQGLELKVQIMEVKIIREPGNPKTAESSGKYVVEVSCRVPEGRHIEGTRAIGAFAEQLPKGMTLSRAEVPVPS